LTVWFGLLLFNDTFSTNRLYCATEVQCISCRAGEQHNHTIEQWNNRKKNKKIIHTLQPGLCGNNPLATVRIPHRSLSSQSLGKYWRLNQNNQKTEHIPTKTNNT